MILSPIHNHDLWTVRGEYGYKPALPAAIGGTEAVGVITDVGAGVDEAMIGQRVAVAGINGTWAQYFVLLLLALCRCRHRSRTRLARN